MGDFYQTGVVATLHRLGSPKLEKLEQELKDYSVNRPIALVLPSLYSELEGEALKGIIRELRQVRYLSKIMITMAQTNKEEFKKAREFFAVLPQETEIIWNDGPNIQELYRVLEKNDISAGPDGKGRSAWMAFGHILADGKCQVIALHDCDILSYNRDMLARLCYPVTSPNLDYEFCKGYYTRVTDRMHGRVTRLFVTPLIRAIRRLLGYLPLLEYLDSFRYALAGEFSMVADLARVNRIPGDWGLEVGTLAEVFRNCAVRRVCQVDLADNYEHKHQQLAPDDPDKGLLKMCIDIAQSLFRTLATEGAILSEGFFKSLVVAYIRTAQDTINKYDDDAAINGLFFDRHEEGMAVEAFAKGVQIAANNFMTDPIGAPLIPNWNRVISAIPDFLDRLKEAVHKDNR
ncbi:MAG: glycosyl transferase [Thermodesulfobacteriota bacterium]